MKIVNQAKAGIIESEGFYIKKRLRGYAILDTRTNFTLGQYPTLSRAEIIFDEMKRNFVSPNKDYYIMPN